MIDTELSNINLNRKKETAVIITSYQPNIEASNILRTSINSLLKFKDESVSIWIFDVGSPKSNNLIKKNEFPNINIIYEKDTPHSEDKFHKNPLGNHFYFSSNLNFFFLNLFNIKTKRNGSYINGWTIDYAINHFNKIEYSPKYFMTLHMDIMVTSKYFFKNLIDKFDKNIFAVGVLKQINFGKQFEILHSLGCLWNYNFIKKGRYSFLPMFPFFDVGEKVIKDIINQGYEFKSFANSYIDKSVLSKIDKKYTQLGEGIDITINDNNEVIFLHLGRGIEKSLNRYSKKNYITVNEWINWFNDNFK